MLKIGAHNKTMFFRWAGSGPDQPSQLVPSTLFNLEGALAVCISLSKSLREAHRHMEVHRALCPSNIRIRDDGLVELSMDAHAPLGYLSPEQSGRMNRGVDYRSDYYLLGVLFYQLLTGRLPFESDNVMELVHSHIAKQPVSPGMLNPELPDALCNIVIKLLSKNAEDRYQSIDGLLADLQHCRTALAETGAIPAFSPGRHDICDRLLIPQKLYGRAAEIEQLIGAFDRIAEGGAELLLVTGYSGIGKSSLVNEIHKPVVARHGYFISGKFDQLKRNIPYYAVAYAFRELIRQILTESESRIADWKIRILDAVGPNGQIIIDAIPEVVHIIGEQPPVSELGSAEAQNRFNYVVQNFVGVFTRPQHPLVVFLDDLQWADAASLKLLRLFMTDLAEPSLLLIGAYRENEVGAGDLLMQTIGKIRKNAKVTGIEVKALSEKSVTELVADTVKSSRETVAQLSRLIYRKTLGNPFFVGQFVKSLYNEKLLEFSNGTWHWDIAQIEALDITDNVVDLLTRELGRLPQDTQRLLRLAACIGSRFDSTTLAAVAEKIKTEMKGMLQPAVQAGLVMAPEMNVAGTTNSFPLYRFLHDRVQQAAYAGIPESEKKTIHLRIGRLLFISIPEEQRDERLFDIVQQLNEGKELLSNVAEMRELAELNLLAARKGKLTIAYETVLKHVAAGLQLLDRAGERASPLYFSLQLEQMETSFLIHRFNAVDQIGKSLLSYAGNSFQKALVFDVLLQSYLYQDRHVEAQAMALEALKMLGIELPEKTGKLKIIVRLLKVKRLMASRTTDELLDLPSQKDPVEILKEQLLSRALSASYVVNPAVFPILIFEQVQTILKNGSYTPASPFAMAGYAMVLIQGFGQIQSGFEIGKLVLALANRKRASARQDGHRVRVEYVVHALIFHWKQHLSSTVIPLYDNYRTGLQIGEFEYATYSLVAALRAELLMGRPLQPLLEKMQLALAKTNSIKQQISADAIAIGIGYASALIGVAGEPAYARKNTEAAMPPRLTLMYRHFSESAKAYLLSDFKAALNSIEQSEIYLGSAACMATLPVFHLYYSLCLLACYPGMDEKQRSGALTKVRKFQKKLKLWSRHAPMNNLHKWQLVEAERCRVLGKLDRAAGYFDLAIKEAGRNGFLNDEALSNELAARFYLASGKEREARIHLEEAHARYADWGASAKVELLEKTYPDLLATAIKKRWIDATAPLTASRQSLDIETFIKASQTLSGEIHLDKLLEKLMRLLIENAGAQKGVLLLQKYGALTIQAMIEGEGIRLRQETAALESADISLGIINYVRRTRQNVVLGDARYDSQFNGDPYIGRAHPKSVMCIPLQKQSELVGILYLENNLAVDAFTPERTELLHILSTQIAISLENAGLYNELEQKVQVRTKALREKNGALNQTLTSLKQMQKQLVESEKLASLGQLVAGVAHEINTPVGIGVTGASTLAEETEKIESLHQAGTMKRSDLDNYIGTASIISKLLLSNMERAATLIQSFKEVAIDQTSEERRTFRLKAYIDDVLLNLRPMLRNAGRQVTVDCPDMIEVDTYPGALSQVLTNFVMNALLHAFDQDNISGRMTIVVNEHYASSIELRFSDNGKGIPQEYLPRIFDPFFTTMRSKGGSGLGLNIVHNLVTGSLQGRISVESAINKGTTFILNFPRNPIKKSIPAATGNDMHGDV
ncbi:MAG: putative two-component system sensory histidine kinase [Herminiimonas sp.]|nr:putative two-component system sensory histidine kinase [Herminiimonas sp.]